ncbi:MAG: GNAT family N-acetyltransferase [Promethearchaeota archaeon]
MIKGKQELEQVLKIREIVFVKGQNVPVKLELDGLDDEATHVIVKYGEKPVGTVRVRFHGDKAKVERLAVLKRHRGKGIGKRALKYAIDYCRRKGVKEVVLNAQYYAKDFYEKLGFKPRGKRFMEADIEHIEMYLVPNST